MVSGIAWIRLSDAPGCAIDPPWCWIRLSGAPGAYVFEGFGCAIDPPWRTLSVANGGIAPALACQ